MRVKIKYISALLVLVALIFISGCYTRYATYTRTSVTEERTIIDKETGDTSVTYTSYDTPYWLVRSNIWYNDWYNRTYGVWTDYNYRPGIYAGFTWNIGHGFYYRDWYWRHRVHPYNWNSNSFPKKPPHVVPPAGPRGGNEYRGPQRIVPIPRTPIHLFNTPTRTNHSGDYKGGNIQRNSPRSSGNRR